MSEYTETKYVTKRNGALELMNFSKIDSRIALQNRDGSRKLRINHTFVTQAVIPLITDNMKTSDIDTITVRVATRLGIKHPDFYTLGRNVYVNNIQKKTPGTFSECVEKCYVNTDIYGNPSPRLNKQFVKFVRKNADVLNLMIDSSRDNRLSLFGLSTLVDRYLLRKSGVRLDMEKNPIDYIIERPQYMWMRVACGIMMNRSNIESELALNDIRKLYDCLSNGYMTFATPALFNIGTTLEQAISCFIIESPDSIGGIFSTLGSVAQISKGSGGIGMVMNLRTEGIEVKSTNGVSGGPIPFLKVFEATALAVDQGGKRPGSFAHYMEPHHPDILSWLTLKRMSTNNKIDKLFYALWISDYFMECVFADKMWYFFDITVAPELIDLYGQEYKTRFIELVDEKKYHGDPVRAQEIWSEIVESQNQSGTPYMLFKNACNSKSNQKNLGTIHGSNLCAEIIEFFGNRTSVCKTTGKSVVRNEIANCVVASLCLKAYVNITEIITDVDEKVNYTTVESFDHKLLADNAGMLTRSLNNVIDLNDYPVEDAKYSNLQHRPLAIGVQGLADAFILMRYPFTSDKAKELNRKIFESIYFGCLRASCDIAKVEGPYETYDGSPISKGIYQFDMWGVDRKSLSHDVHDWKALFVDIKQHGVRNSLLTSCPPTASTSQIQDNSPCFEPYVSNIFNRRTMSGEFLNVNLHLVEDLIKLNLWSDKIRSQIRTDRGSIQNIEEIPTDIKELYKTVWELRGKDLIDMSADRGAFVCQSQSMNVFMKNVTAAKLSASHKYAWKKGLKTGMYYLRSQPVSDAVQFTARASEVNFSTIQSPPQQNKKKYVCTDDICVSCSA
jgi:ribonucleoside-diphosphate reductase alpha subunit